MACEKGGETSRSDLLTLYLNAVRGGDRRVRLVEVTDDEVQIRTGSSHSVVLAIPEPVAEFMFMFDSRHSCFKTDTPSEAQEGQEPPVSSEPQEGSGNAVPNDDSTDR